MKFRGFFDKMTHHFFPKVRDNCRSLSKMSVKISSKGYPEGGTHVSAGKQ